MTNTVVLPHDGLVLRATGPSRGASMSLSETAFAEPVRRVTARWVTGLVLVNMGINAAVLSVPSTSLLGSRPSALMPRQGSPPVARDRLWCRPPWWPTFSSARFRTVPPPAGAAGRPGPPVALGRRSPCVLAGAALTTAALPGTCPLAACHALRTTE